MRKRQRRYITILEDASKRSLSLLKLRKRAGLRHEFFTPLKNAVLPQRIFLRGFTKFEKKIYYQVFKIPRGQTRTYKWVAGRIGHPKAYRAVGNALNKNPYPGVIPCHRVIRSDGCIGGFSKGLAAKKSLLSKEGIVI